MKQNIVLRIGLIPSTLIFTAAAVIVSVLLTVVLFDFFVIELTVRNAISAVIIPSLVAPPIILYYGKLLVAIANTEGVLRDRTSQLEAALADVKQLSGLLPICASCKDIRDDQGYWNAIERYISSRTEATFTHGLCPDCVDRLYPDLKLP